jgi:type II secretory pathway pseudopilin PulG
MSGVGCPEPGSRPRQLTTDHSPLTTPHSAFTFTEVMFAVILLGVGFIMLAAIFPVAIRQTQSTIEETVGSWLAQSAVRSVQHVATDALMPPTAPAGDNGLVLHFRDRRNANGDAGADALWSAIRGDLIPTQDPRFAWIPLYKRNYGDTTAQLIILGVQSRNRPAYQAPRDLQRHAAGAVSDLITNPNPATLEPREVAVTLTAGGANPDTVTFSGDGAAAAAEGAFFVIADDQTPGAVGATNGFLYRVGNNVGGDTWELAAGHDLKGGSLPTVTARALIVGRGYRDPTRPEDGLEGPAQDVAAYTTFIRLN